VEFDVHRTTATTSFWNDTDGRHRLLDILHDHKRIGLLYFYSTSLSFRGGAARLLLRIELMAPGRTIMVPDLQRALHRHGW